MIAYFMPWCRSLEKVQVTWYCSLDLSVHLQLFEERAPVMYTFNKPIHTLFLLVFLLLPESTSILAQEVTWKGFVSSESYFDSKEAVASREADVLLYPKRPVFDNLNNDQTDIRSFHMVSFNSRLQAKASDFEAFGATSSAVIEIDFLGTGENYVNMIRMRHAFVKLKWEKSTVLMEY